MALLLTAAVFIFLQFHGSDLMGKEIYGDGKMIEVTGVVEHKELKKGFDNALFPVIYIIPADSNTGDDYQVQCYFDREDKYVPSIGEAVTVRGIVKNFSSPTNPGEFDSRLYYSTLKISYRLTGCEVIRSDKRVSLYKESLFRIRIYLENALDATLSGEDAGVMKAMLLGDRSSMDEELKDLYSDNGIMHILAVSGLHISIIGMGLYRLMKRIGAGKITACLFPIFFMYSYGIMCGMGASSFRAICMFVLCMMAPVLGRTYDILSGLALAGILLLLEQPLYLLSSGFTFSFGAIVGIVCLKPILKDVIRGNDKDRMEFFDDKKDRKKNAIDKLSDTLLTGISIAIATLPVYAAFYFAYPVHSLILNLFVIPLMGFVMIMGIVCMAVGGLLPFIGFIPGFFVHVILSFYRLLCSFTFLRSNLTWYMGYSDKWHVLAYLSLISISVASAVTAKKAQKDKNKKTKFINRNMAFRLVSVLALISAVFVLTFHPAPKLSITMLDVGQGDGIIVSCNRKNILIDGGSSSKKSVGKYCIIPALKYYGIGCLDLIIVSHEDNDHISGILEIFDDMEKGGIRVKKLMLPEIDPDCAKDNYKKLENRAKELGIEILYINAGEKFSEGNAEFICLNPEKGKYTGEANEYSAVLFMKYESFTALFTGDVEGTGQDGIKEIISKNPGMYDDITLLKVAHHGSRFTTDEEFLEMTSPKLALISCGRNNVYSHPHDELIYRLTDAGCRILRTDKMGAVTVRYQDNRVILDTFLGF